MNITPMNTMSKGFYYMHSGFSNTFLFRVKVIFEKEINKQVLQRVFKKTLKHFPEFAVRPVIKHNKPAFERNERDIACFEDEVPRLLGTEETNGYAYCIHLKQKEMLFSIFHGISDFYGIRSFIQTFLYYYGEETNENVTNETKQMLRKCPDSEPGVVFDVCKDKSITKGSPLQWDYNDPDAFVIPEELFSEECDQIHLYKLSVNNAQFYQKVKEQKTTFAAFMIRMVSCAIAQVYEAEEKPIIAVLPMDSRAYYNFDTVSNFTNSALIPYELTEQEKSVKEQCADLKNYIDLQQNRENFDRILSETLKNQQQIEDSGEDIIKLNRMFQKLPPKGSKRPVTYALTYLGKLDLPKELSTFVKKLEFEGYSRGTNVAVSRMADHLIFNFAQRFDSDKLIENCAAYLREMGIECSVSDSGYIRGDKVLLEQLKRIE